MSTYTCQTHGVILAVDDQGDRALTMPPVTMPPSNASPGPCALPTMKLPAAGQYGNCNVVQTDDDSQGGE